MKAPEMEKKKKPKRCFASGNYYNKAQTSVLRVCERASELQA